MQDNSICMGIRIDQPGLEFIAHTYICGMVNIVKNKDVTFEEYKFDEQQFRSILRIINSLMVVL